MMQSHRRITQTYRQKVLIVDDAVDNIKIFVNLLRDDYDTFFAKDGKSALKIVFDIMPDIILLDIIMPEMDGYEVCRQLKSDRRVADIPVIFISAKNQVEDETLGLDLGAIDYITKPASPAILKARVRNHLQLSNAMKELRRLYSMALDASPLTGLPGNNSIAKQIESALFNEEKICVVYADLDNFKAFNDKYGFAKGDEVILFTSRVLEMGLKANGVFDYFIGHIGGDDFVFTSPLENAHDVAQSIMLLFDEGIIGFYTPEDAANKCILSFNRKGEKQVFPIISVSMAGVDISAPHYKKYIQVNDAFSEAKKKAKSIQGSSFVMDRRKPVQTKGFI
ncbi:MAG: response regulator [Desulfamplus sp.]|nr:response regulator [Desulfamplus sp.]